MTFKRKTSEISLGYCQCGCGKETNIAKYDGKNQTKGHHVRYVQGHNQQRNPNHPNYSSRRFKIEGKWCRTIPLTRGLEAIVDDADYSEISRYTWTAFADKKNKRFYAARYDNNHVLHRMHRDIMSATGDGEIDHKNGNDLDNRRSNLRTATNANNAVNALPRKRKNSASAYKGVTLLPTGRWRAVINRDRHIGCFAVETDAAKAYDAAARKLYGEFACVNFPRRGERGCLGN